MTNMKRVTFSLPHELDEKIVELRKDDAFIRASYSEIVRTLVMAGLELVKQESARADDQHVPQ